MDIKKHIKLVVLSVIIAATLVVTASSALAYHQSNHYGGLSPYSGSVTIGALYGVHNDVYVQPVYSQGYSYPYYARMGAVRGTSSHYIHGLRPGVYSPAPVVNYPQYAGNYCQWPCRTGGYYNGATRPTGHNSRYVSY